VHLLVIYKHITKNARYENLKKKQAQKYFKIHVLPTTKNKRLTENKIQHRKLCGIFFPLSVKSAFFLWGNRMLKHPENASVKQDPQTEW
jgi:hypothetical protein